MPDNGRIYGHCRACHMNCPAYYTVENGRVVNIEAVPMDEGGIGELCHKGLSSIQFEYSPTRVRYPLKRVGKRGEGKWERISWDQATTEIAEKVYDLSKKYGPETFALPGRTGRQDMGWIASKIARTIGTPNNYYGAIQVCLLPQFHDQVQYGTYLQQKMGTDPRCRLYVSVGNEFNSSNDPILGKFFTLARQSGMQHIALDPVGGSLAAKADLWLPVRPGTDLAFFLCVINFLIETGRYAADFLKEWTNAPFLVRADTGDFLVEGDVLKDGSSDRYLFWDATSNGVKFWDKKEIQWEGGASGKAHFEACEERFYRGKGSFDLSPAVKPESIDPALFGNYEVTLKSGHKVSCKPAFQICADNVKQWNFEKTEEVTGISVDRISTACEMMSTIHPMDISCGVQYMSTNTSQYCLSANLVKMMTGNIDVPGGCEYVQFYPVEPMTFPGEWDISYNEGLPLSQKRKRLGYYEHRIGCGQFYDEEWTKWQPMRPENADALLNFPDVNCVLTAIEEGIPYPVHGIFSISSNFLMHDPSLGRWLKVLNDEEKIKLHVCTEMVMTPTAEMADYVLPAATWMERNYLEFGTLGANATKNFFRKAVEPLGEAKQDYAFGAMLAHKLEKLDPAYNHGLLNPEGSLFFGGEYGTLWENDDIDEERDRLTRRFFGKSLEECFDLRRVAAEQYEMGAQNYRYLVAGRIPTDTGKINFFSTMHNKYGYPPLPVYTEPAESPVSRPDLAKDYPLILSTGKRQVGFFHSEFRQLPLTRSLSPWPEVMMNPETAAEYGVTHGDWVWVEAPPTSGREDLHRIMGMVSFRFPMRPGQVTYAQHAWWRPEKAATDDLHGALEWNAEVLLECKHSAPETGTPGLRSQLCTVYKCSDADIKKYQPVITREQLEALMPVSGEEM